MEIFKYNNYLDLLTNWLKSQPKQGRGLMQKLAHSLRVSTVLISQIFSGTRLLQLDYAYGIASFIGLTQSETEYFLLLVQFENAGTDEYKKYLSRKIKLIQANSLEIKNRVAKDIQLSEEAKAQFYSHWHYSAVRLLTDIPELNTALQISSALSLEANYVAEILEFLVSNKLCNLENGLYTMAIKSTHLENNSPWIYSRQMHWRQKAIQKMETQKKNDLYYTAPMVLADSDIKIIRDKILKLIREATELARESKSESLMCLNLDWFEIYSK